MDKVYMYLRKSRVDIEKEKEGELETLQRHKSILLKFASEQKLNVVKIFEEIVSGESIIQRPKMLELLKEADDHLFNAVLCMDIDRLGRGNMQDQGLILETFKSANIKIITPRKTYDLLDEFDEEYSEFEAFMARKELKMIKRRLYRGRIKSVEEGNYLGAFAPYGYMFSYNEKGKYLIPHPEQSEVVKLIFESYLNGNLGAQKVASKLNSLGYTSYSNKEWDSWKVNRVLKNHVYAGKIVWHKRRSKKPTSLGAKKESRNNPKDEWIIVNGKHEAIISEENFNTVQELLEKKYHVPYNTNIANPLAGLITCKICGSSMVLKRNGKGEKYIICYRNCGNRGSKIDYVEEKIITFLKNFVLEHDNIESKNHSEKYKNVETLSTKIYKKALKNLENLEKQRNNIHDLLEKGIYDVNTFIDRSHLLSEKIDKCLIEVEALKKQLEIEDSNLTISSSLIPKIKEAIDMYYLPSTPEEKNIFLKSVIEKIIYFKEKTAVYDNFEITIKTKY